jgi:hypothetical protein
VVRNCVKPTAIRREISARVTKWQVIRKSWSHQRTAVMDYEPWPENGCSLAEARQRTDESVLSGQHVQVSGSPTRATWSDHLKDGRLVAYGRPGREHAETQLISMGQWGTLTRIEWQHSAATDDQAKIEFSDIRVYPPLLAPCRVDLLASRTLAEAFERFVLGDPEVAALGREAVRLSPKYQALFVRGRCQIHGFEEWPLAFERSVMASTVHPEIAKRSKFEIHDDPDLIEVVVAAEALKHRYRTLISILRRAELEGRGLLATTGQTELILRSIWSHEDFHLDASTGDILQDNQESTGRYDRLIRRWIGVVLQRSSLENVRVYDHGVMFHGKPFPHDGLLSATPTPQEAAIKQSRAVGRIETKLGARKACESWLIKMMEGSKDKRLYSIEALWVEAQSKWPGILSERQFLAARSEAIQLTNAFAWGAAGAPRKSPHSNRRTD